MTISVTITGRSHCSVRKFLRNSAKFTGKHLCQGLFVRVISLRLFRQKLNLMSGDKCYQSTTPKSNHLEGNICACVYFIKTKVVDQQIKNSANLFYFFRNEN